MPQPHEQKLHEVVNSLTFESFISCVAVRIARTSRSSPSASPAPPATVRRKRSRRLIWEADREWESPGISEGSAAEASEAWDASESAAPVEIRRGGASRKSSMRFLR